MLLLSTLYDDEGIESLRVRLYVFGISSVICLDRFAAFDHMNIVLSAIMTVFAIDFSRVNLKFENIKRKYKILNTENFNSPVIFNF